MSKHSDGQWAADVIGEVLLTPDQIATATRRLGQEITRDYAGKDLLVVGVLRGAFVFMSDLIRTIELPVSVDFMSVSSYGQSTKSSGIVRIVKDLASSIAGKNVLIIEDVVDTGLTWAYLKHLLELRNPASIKMCALLDKPVMRKTDVTVDYVGFTIGDQFVVGYGLDWKDKYRNLPFVMAPKR